MNWCAKCDKAIGSFCKVCREKEQILNHNLHVVSMMHQAMGNIIKAFYKGKEDKKKLWFELDACVNQINENVKLLSKGVE
mgnify:CR=1 FL=1